MPASSNACTCADPPTEPSHPLTVAEIEQFRLTVDACLDNRAPLGVAPQRLACIASMLLDELERVKEERDGLHDRIRSMDGKWRRAVSFARNLAPVK